MRLLPLALLALLALAAAPASSTPAACAGDCEIRSHSYVTVPPVFEVRSGAELRWTSLDSTHVNLDGSGAGDVSRYCFRVTFDPREPSPAVRFDLDGARLTATTAPGTRGESTRECAAPAFLPDGSAVLTYYCLLHPVMRGSLVVSPA